MCYVYLAQTYTTKLPSRATGNFQGRKYDMSGVIIIFIKQKDPPVYHPERMTTPTVFFTGGLDVLADPSDVEWLRQLLPKEVLIGDYYIPEYEHSDFTLATNAPDKVYKYIIETARKYQ